MYVKVVSWNFYAYLKGQYMVSHSFTFLVKPDIFTFQTGQDFREAAAISNEHSITNQV